MRPPLVNRTTLLALLLILACAASSWGEQFVLFDVTFHDDIVWSEGIRQMDLVIKDGTGTKYDPKLVPNLPSAGERK